MGVKLAEGVVEVTADGTKIPRDVARDIDNNQSHIDGAGRRSGSLFTSVFGGSLLGSALGGIASDLVGQIGYAIGSGIRAAVDFGMRGIDLAGSLEQSVGAVDAVFGGLSGQIHARASTANQDVGLTANAYNELATVLGSQLKNGGTAIDEVAGKTSGLITLGADMSAMFGGTAADAVGALSAALRGERDTIEKYGVSLTQASVDARAMELGLWDGAGAMSEQAKQAATLSLIYEQTAAAQGMFAGESDTLAGQQQRLAASFEEAQTKLGVALLPAMTALATMANETLVPMLDDLIGKVGPQLSLALSEAAPAFVGMVEAIVPHIPALMQLAADALPGILEAIGFLVPMLIEIAGSFSLGWEQISTFFTNVFGGLDAFDAKMTEGRLQVEGFFAGVVARFQLGAEQIGQFFGAVGGFFAAFGARLGEGAAQIGGFFSYWGGRLAEGGAQIAGFVGVVGQKIGEAVAFVAELPGRAASALGDLGGRLFSAGQSLIQGFIDGIGDMIGGVGEAIGGVLDFAAGFFPNSPAKRGPFSGSGWTALGRSGLAIGEQFRSGLDAASFSVPFTTTAGGNLAFAGSGATSTAGGFGGGPVNITIHESTDPLGSAGRVAAEMRRWGKK